jgi:hypothetical protein
MAQGESGSPSIYFVGRKWSAEKVVSLVFIELINLDGRMVPLILSCATLLQRSLEGPSTSGGLAGIGLS